MKKLLFSISIISVLFSFSACTKDDNSPSNNNSGTVTGQWIVSQFSERGEDNSHDFTGYTFSFNENSVLAAVKAGATQNGTWSKTSTKFNIDLGAKGNSNLLGELTDDWKIISISDSKIELTDDNSTSQEFLTFTKN